VQKPWQRAKVAGDLAIAAAAVFSAPARVSDGLRFFRRRILSGLTLNLSKRGMSVSAGVRGAHLTLKTKGQVTTTVGRTRHRAILD
jgi:hypothetical protein